MGGFVVGSCPPTSGGKVGDRLGPNVGERLTERTKVHQRRIEIDTMFDMNQTMKN